MTKSQTIKFTLQTIINNNLKTCAMSPALHALVKLGYLTATPAAGDWAVEVTPRGHNVINFSRNQAARMAWAKATR